LIIGLVGVLREQVAGIGGVRDFDLMIHAPCASVLIFSGEDVSSSLTAVTLPEDWRVEIGDGLDRFDAAENLALSTDGADFRQIDEDDVAERVLRVVGDADLALLPLSSSIRVLWCICRRRDSRASGGSSLIVGARRRQTKTGEMLDVSRSSVGA